MSSDEAAIIRRIRDFSHAWNSGDAKAAAGFYAEDGVRAGAAGDVQHGRVEIAEAYERLWSGSFAGASVRQEDGEVRMLTPELAVWRGGIEIQPPDGSPVARGQVVQVMKKISGAWMILDADAKLFPRSPN